MRPPGLAETANKGGIVRLQEDQLGVDQPPQAGEHFGKTLQAHSFAHVNYQCRGVHCGVVADELSELRDQFDGQVVHRVVAKVFKGLQRARLTRAAHSRHDHQLTRAHGQPI